MQAGVAELFRFEVILLSIVIAVGDQAYPLFEYKQQSTIGKMYINALGHDTRAYSKLGAMNRFVRGVYEGAMVFRVDQQHKALQLTLDDGCLVLFGDCGSAFCNKVTWQN